MFDFSPAAADSACRSCSRSGASLRSSGSAAEEHSARSTASSSQGRSWNSHQALGAGVAQLAVRQLQRGRERQKQSVREAIGQAVVDALVASGIDLRQPPSLEEIKELVWQVARAAREHQPGNSA